MTLLFQNSVMSGLTEAAEFSYGLLHSICDDVLFSLKYIKKIQPCDNM